MGGDSTAVDVLGDGLRGRAVAHVAGARLGCRPASGAPVRPRRPHENRHLERAVAAARAAGERAERERTDTGAPHPAARSRDEED